MVLVRAWNGIRQGERSKATSLAATAAVLAGAAVRLSFVLRADFALNDGGLFFVMTRELQQSRYALPAFTAYNRSGIPFAYPPLGLYLAGAIDELGPWSLMDVYRFLPVALNVATMAAFYSLAGRLLSSKKASVFALFAFALLPRSFHWLIMGGGVARSPGLLLAVLAIQQAFQMYTGHRGRHVSLTAILLAGTIACHLEMALLATCAIAILFVAYGRNRRGLIHSLLVATGALAASSPWWATVIARHGTRPFLSASEHGWGIADGVVNLLLLRVTEESHFPLLASLALLGTLTCVANRRCLLPAWVVALFAMDPRSAHTSATVPLAMLAGVGLSEQLLPAVAQCGVRVASSEKAPDRPRSREQTCPGHARLQHVVLGSILAYALVSAAKPEGALLTALSREERGAMQWAAEHTPQSSRFLVVTGDMWAVDRSSEWFPVLAQRVSVATVQGSEWLPAFTDVIDRSTAVQRCAAQGADCLECWSAQEEIAFDYVYVATRASIAWGDSSDSCCSRLQRALRGDPRYGVVYDGPGATIYRREPQAASRACSCSESGPDAEHRPLQPRPEALVRGDCV